MDEKLVRALEQDYTKAPITKAERAMLDYVVQLTKDATRMRISGLKGSARISPADTVT